MLFKHIKRFLSWSISFSVIQIFFKAACYLTKKSCEYFTFEISSMTAL